MLEIPNHLKYSVAHTWVESLGDDLIRVGLTDYAQDKVGYITFIQLPDVDTIYSEIEECFKIESVNGVKEFYSPLTGEIVDINYDLEENPDLINVEPYEDGWIFLLKRSVEPEPDRLIDADNYADFISNIK